MGRSGLKVEVLALSLYAPVPVVRVQDPKGNTMHIRVPFAGEGGKEVAFQKLGTSSEQLTFHPIDGPIAHDLKPLLDDAVSNATRDGLAYQSQSSSFAYGLVRIAQGTAALKIKAGS